MSNITILATGKINAVNTLTIELVEADETPRSLSSGGPPRRGGRWAVLRLSAAGARVGGAGAGLRWPRAGR
jgi:hypothetical protein